MALDFMENWKLVEQIEHERTVPSRMQRLRRSDDCGYVKSCIVLENLPI